MVIGHQRGDVAADTGQHADDDTEDVYKRQSYAHGYYERDNRFYQDWDPIARNRDTFTAWIDQYIRDTEDFAHYQAKVKGEAK